MYGKCYASVLTLSLRRLESEKSLLGTRKENRATIRNSSQCSHSASSPAPPAVSRSSVLCCGGLVQVSKCETWIPEDSWALLLKNATLCSSAVMQAMLDNVENRVQQGNCNLYRFFEQTLFNDQSFIEDCPFVLCQTCLTCLHYRTAVMGHL